MSKLVLLKNVPCVKRSGKKDEFIQFIDLTISIDNVMLFKNIDPEDEDDTLFVVHVSQNPVGSKRFGYKNLEAAQKVFDDILAIMASESTAMAAVDLLSYGDVRDE